MKKNNFEFYLLVLVFENIFPNKIISHRFFLLLTRMGITSSPIIIFIRIFAYRDPKPIIPTMSLGSINGHSTGLIGCTGMSKRMWNTFPSIHDNTRTGVNLQISFVFTLSSPKKERLELGTNRLS